MSSRHIDERMHDTKHITDHCIVHLVQHTYHLHNYMYMHICHIMQNELEVALVLNGISYVGLGWKPMDAGLNSSCNSEIPKYLPPGI